ncbi:hypothetical protein [Sinimarinibacterium thermocellulolyticum]|uniref:Uncharacterized protein n=1 Tax=Sinimarinibacterium thermocellulolyticum TaxID=3170016 RepID=A0ABV2AB12_9GAMM
MTAGAALLAVAYRPVSSEPPLLRQPTWPYHWAGAAQRLAAEADFSAAFDEALAMAAHYGPSERKLRLHLALLGLRHWDALSERARALTQAHVDASLRVQSGALLRAAFAMRRETLVCARVGDDPELLTVCERYAGLRRLCDRPRPSIDLTVWCLERYAQPRHPPRAAR